jgi:hypothetical protein
LQWTTVAELEVSSSLVGIEWLPNAVCKSHHVHEKEAIWVPTLVQSHSPTSPLVCCAVEQKAMQWMLSMLNWMMQSCMLKKTRIWN